MKIWVIPLIGLGLITIGSLLPGDQIPVNKWTSVTFLDKLIHFGAYAMIAFSAGVANRYYKILGSSSDWWILLSVIAAYSGIIEILQGAFFEDRYFEVLDLIANITGLLTGYLLSVRLLKNRTHAA